MASRKMLSRAKKLATKIKASQQSILFGRVCGAARLVNFTVQRIICHRETSPKLKLELKKETSCALCGINT